MLHKPIHDMTTEFCSVIRTVQEALLAVRLLTRNVRWAETAVEEAIACDLVSLVSTECLAIKAIERAIPLSTLLPDGITSEEDSNSAADLPPELIHVLHMPEEWRYCFVLCVLVGACEETCASILSCPTVEVRARVCAAMTYLAHRRDRFNDSMYTVSEEVKIDSNWRRYGKSSARLSRDAQ